MSVEQVKAMPQWIWHEKREERLKTSISVTFEVPAGWNEVTLCAAFTGAAEVRLNGSVIETMDEEPDNASGFRRIGKFPAGLPKGAYTLEFVMNCSQIVPIVSVNSYLSARRVGLIAFLQSAEGAWIPTGAEWRADDDQAAVICHYGEEPFGDLTGAPPWFAQGGYHDIGAYPIRDVQAIASALMTAEVSDGSLSLCGGLPGDLSLPRFKAKQLELFYHLRKQNEWKRMRQFQQEQDLQKVPACTIDLGKEYNARLIAANNSEAAVKILWNGAESLHELEHYDGQITEWLELAPGETGWTLPQGYRYMRIYVWGSAGVPFQLSLRWESLHVKLNQVGQAQTAPPLLGQIYDTAVHTSKICHQMGLWDGIKRDRLNWTFDFYLAGRAGYYMWDDYAALQRSIRELGAGTPYGEWMNSICEYTLWWIKAVCEYYFYTGDKDFVLEMKEPLERHVRWVASNIDQDRGGLTIDKFILIEWVPLTEQEKHTSLQAILKLTRDDLAKLITSVPELELAFHWPVQELDDAAFMAEDNQLATKVLGIISGYVSPEAAKDFLESCRLEDPFTPLSAFTLAECCSRYGLHDRAYEIITSVWGNMIARGATTFWESYTDQIDAHRDFHDALTTYTSYDSYRISLCHAWSSTPVKWITEYVLGVRPLEPGFRSISFQPHAPGGLTSCSGAVHTPFGPITVSWKLGEDGEMEAELHAPEAVKVLKDASHLSINS